MARNVVVALTTTRIRPRQRVAVFTAGEEHHNDHHGAPASAGLSRRRYEPDLGWWILRALVIARLASLRTMTTGRPA